MNEKFWALPKDKRDRIINAALEVFAKNEYKKAPMSEIAREAGISKSLLFHYFHNKKELYLFLYDYALDFMMRELNKEDLVQERDFIEMFRRSLLAKCRIAREYIYMNQFMMQAYFEDEPEVKECLADRTTLLLDESMGKILDIIDTSKFRRSEDAAQLLKNSIWLAEGYLFHQSRTNSNNVDQWEKDFIEIIEFWKQGYYREEYL